MEIKKTSKASLENKKSSWLLVGRLEDDHFCLDPRTLENKEYPLLLRALRMALQAAESNHNRQGI